MLKSMTGYGRVKVENDLREITVELRSVNHRYLDLNIKVPRIYGYLEEMVSKQAQAAIARGKVDIFVSVRAKEGADIRVSPNMAVIQGYVDAIKKVSETYGLSDEATALSLLRLPDAMEQSKEEADADQLKAEVSAVLDQALTEYNAMREKEGARLVEDVTYRAGLIAQSVDYVEQRSPDCVEEYRQRIAARMTELLDGTELAQQRILQEAALYADKVNVTEEIVRLRSHLAQLETMLKSPAAIGRKLDFLVQEMNRETNTIGSKANDFQIAKTVVDMKAEIEKIREQIQNLE
ncbi:MAG: YicC/YloC family endoribonuclease [Clostridiaceae bacterium]|nr:YicC family protein [Clostridia bacterium]MDY3869733.1 YicC/YloC family endoribonuclease [Clostridiaceae bacterium]